MLPFGRWEQVTTQRRFKLNLKKNGTSGVCLFEVTRVLNYWRKHRHTGGMTQRRSKFQLTTTWKTGERRPSMNTRISTGVQLPLTETEYDGVCLFVQSDRGHEQLRLTRRCLFSFLKLEEASQSFRGGAF